MARPKEYDSIKTAAPLISDRGAPVPIGTVGYIVDCVGTDGFTLEFAKDNPKLVGGKEYYTCFAYTGEFTLLGE